MRILRAYKVAESYAVEILVYDFVELFPYGMSAAFARSLALLAVRNARDGGERALRQAQYLADGLFLGRFCQFVTSAFSAQPVEQPRL